MRRVLAVVMVATVGVVLTVCESTTGGSAKEPGVDTVNVELTDKGCTPARIVVKAGPTTFAVENAGADGVTEFEVLDGGKILGEKENLAPGLSGRFTITLKEGTYVTYCPGGSPNERGSLVVGAAAEPTTPQDAGAVQQAISTYKTDVADEASQLVVATTAFADAVKAGDVAQAKQLYPAARADYGTIEPIAESFGDLDRAIDAREGDVPTDEWAGFHRIEQALWAGNTAEGMGPVADQLVADVTRLQNEIPGLVLEPGQIANGAVDLLNEVVTSKITGEEDRYSHTDLRDVEANVRGACAAFDAVEPLVTARDPKLAARIPATFDAVLTVLTPFRLADGFITTDHLTAADTRKLTTAVDLLAGELGKVPPVVQG